MMTSGYKMILNVEKFTYQSTQHYFTLNLQWNSLLYYFSPSHSQTLLNLPFFSSYFPHHHFFFSLFLYYITLLHFPTTFIFPDCPSYHLPPTLVPFIPDTNLWCRHSSLCSWPGNWVADPSSRSGRRWGQGHLKVSQGSLSFLQSWSRGNL